MSRSAIWDGFKATLPVWLGVAPFGVAYALAAKAIGLSWAVIVGMSMLVYAGSVQVAVVQLLAVGASLPAMLMTTLLIQSRMVLPSSSLAPYVQNLSRGYRAVLAFALADATYVLSLPRFNEGRDGARFLLGSNLSLYLCWNLSTIAGLLFQEVLSRLTTLGLDLVIPLSFLALTVPYLRSIAGATAVAVGGGVALLIHLWLPGSWHILAGAVVGSMAGALVEEAPWKRG